MTKYIFSLFMRYILISYNNSNDILQIYHGVFKLSENEGLAQFLPGGLPQVHNRVFKRTRINLLFYHQLLKNMTYIFIGSAISADPEKVVYFREQN